MTISASVSLSMLLISSISLQGMYHWRKDLESVKLLEVLRTAYEYDLPLESYKEQMHKEFIENEDKTNGIVARQTVLSHALRENYPSEFAAFLKDKGVIDPVSSNVSPAVSRKQ